MKRGPSPPQTSLKPYLRLQTRTRHTRSHRDASTRVNHILRVTKPKTKRATIICPNSLSQIGAWGLRFNYIVGREERTLRFSLVPKAIRAYAERLPSYSQSLPVRGCDQKNSGTKLSAASLMAGREQRVLCQIDNSKVHTQSAKPLYFKLAELGDVVFITAGPIVKLCAGGEGGQ
jgi:hypothetical protein